MKKKNALITIICMAFLFFFGASNVKALETVIEEYPIASDIVYGEPLFQSRLNGGKANVDGIFSWKNDKEILEIGTYEKTVVFSPFNQAYEEKEFLVSVVVNKRRVYIKFEDDIYKQYDGSNNISLPNYVIGGVIDKGVFVRGELTGKLESSLVGESLISLEGIELVGEKSFNYYLDLNNFKATIYRTSVEKFGDIKDKIEFSENTYVASDALIYVEELEGSLFDKKGYKVLNAYDIYLKSGGDRIDISKKVNVKINIAQENFNYEKLEIYNYYNGAYKKIDYKYEDGYIMYTADSLGNLVFTQKIENYWWVYLSISLFIFGCFTFFVIKSFKGKEKINRYKSLKRSKDYENY